jgi:HEAT repeat protein
MFFALCLAGFVGAVVVPAWQTCRTVERYGRGELGIFTLTRKLGDQQTGARKLRFYLRLPERLAPRRDRAVRMISTCGQHALIALPEIIEVLEDEPGKVRLAAAEALAEEGDPRAVDHLLVFLRTRDDLSLGAAADALGEIGDRRAVQPLARLLESEVAGWNSEDPNKIARDHWETDREHAAIAAARALGKLKDRRGIPALIGLLKFGRETSVSPHGCRCGLAKKRGQAFWALYRVGRPAIPALIDCFRLTDCAGGWWGWGYLYGGPYRHCSRLKESPKVGACAARILLKIGRPSIPPLVAALGEDDEQTRRYAMETLVEFGTPAVKPLLPALKHSRPETRWRAAAALGQIGCRCAVPELLPLLEDSDAMVRAWTAASLGRMRDRRATAALVARLGDADRRVRVQAAWALKALADPRAADGLIRALGDAQPHVRRGAAVALGAARDPRAFDLLLARLGDEDVGVRAGAAEGLGLLEDARAVESLAVILRSGETFERSAAARALGRIGGSRPLELLTAALGEKDRWVRWNVVKALGETGDPRAAAPLRAVVKNKAPNDAVEVALEYLERLKNGKSRATVVPGRCPRGP